MTIDWDDAYTNSAYIDGGDAYADRWAASARHFRDTHAHSQLDLRYGPGPRQVYDLFLPDRAPRGVAVFVHGGYFLLFDKSSWSHLAQGAIAQGFAVAIPSYTLAPHARVTAIVSDIAQAVTAIADRVAGPIYLAGHSAGGHLVTRLICDDTALADPVRMRVRHVLSISGLHDLRPLQQTKMGHDLFSDDDEAARQSPALHRPMRDARVTCWVGQHERPEFLRQSRLLANIWHGLGADTTLVEMPGRHHFDVIDDLAVPQSVMMRAFLPAA